VVAPGILLVARNVALATSPRVMKNRATVNIGQAPRVKATVGQVIRLVTRVGANTAYVIKIKVGGTYYDIGTARSDGNGQMSLPAFIANRAGTYTIAIINPTTGVTVYVKVAVNARR
jgi:hypothetical protein